MYTTSPGVLGDGGRPSPRTPGEVVYNAYSAADRIRGTEGVASTLSSEGGGTGAKTGLYCIDMGGGKSGAAVSATVTAKWAKQAGGPAGSASENNNCVIHQIAPTLSTKNEVASSSTQREKWQEQSAELFGAVRRLTPVECCRLQGFPDDWNDDQTDSQRYRQMGNAVCVPVAEWIGRRIAEYGDGPKDG